MSAYDNYLKSKLEYTASKQKEIEHVNKTEIPEYVLWQKTVADQLINEGAKYKTINDKFYFTELLVNKLMYFSYLMGSKAINQVSFEEGWRAHRENVLRRLEIVESIDRDNC